MFFPVLHFVLGRRWFIACDRRVKTRYAYVFRPKLRTINRGFARLNEIWTQSNDLPKETETHGGSLSGEQLEKSVIYAVTSS